jgi:hypothetical protein
MWGLLVLTACTSNLKKENEALRDEIDERREHLENSLKVNLEAARQELAVTDSLLGIAKREHDEQHEWVMSHATALGEQSPEVLRLNRLRAQRDSLQVEFERQAQKVKFYMKKTEERAAN